MDRDIRFMTLALELARQAAREGDVPVGAVCVLGDEVISVGRNRREERGNAVAHAEVEAIDLACKRLGGWNLWRCELYVTLEPCIMCSGAIVNSRIGRVVYGARDVHAERKFGFESLAPSVAVVSGVLEEECSGLLAEFFADVRTRRNGWRPTERIMLGDSVSDWENTIIEPRVYAVVGEGDDIVVVRREDGTYELPWVSRAKQAPMYALRRKCPELEPASRLLTLVERVCNGDDYIMRDNIFVRCCAGDCEAVSRLWDMPACRASQAENMTEITAKAINYIKESGL